MLVGIGIAEMPALGIEMPVEVGYGIVDRLIGHGRAIELGGTKSHKSPTTAGSVRIP